MIGACLEDRNHWVLLVGIVAIYLYIISNREVH